MIKKQTGNLILLLTALIWGSSFVAQTTRHGACAAVYVHGHSYRARRTGFDSRYFVPAAHAAESAAPVRRKYSGT